MKHYLKFLVASLGILIFIQMPLVNAADMDERIHKVTNILEKKQGSSSQIPRAVLKQAKAVAILSITKGAIGIGGQGGEGIIVVRNGSSWSAPSAFNLGGASIGAQIGFTETDYIIVINNPKVISSFTSDGKMTWDATASGTSGTDNATERTSSSDLERGDVVVYKDSNGVFGGATLGGTTIERQDGINERAYGNRVFIRDILNGKVSTPASAKYLYLLLDGSNKEGMNVESR